ncbi:hypothetical protein SMACR_01110 [Sordaria macrospora]|uniref:Uncharacterized protein n=1 Tax=Sordaria macrospora TaxID=5147 RepID=A0A8S8ZLW0_SORMA|nr:hypothetical protein SMACR_01110 [Sordaria macrospora]WPJ62345.1 hypothetical protein SMAC4_01110 [Sordaria macrospora]
MPNLTPQQLASLLNTLTSIDQRLNRIEAALRLNNNVGNTNGNANQTSTGTPVAPTASVLAHPSLSAVGRTIITNAQSPSVAQLRPHPPPPSGSSSRTSNLATIHAAAQAQAQSSELNPLDPPPQGYTISSRASMQEELDHWTIPRGYSMRIAGAKVTGKKKVRWVCFRGGEARHHRPPVDESVIQAAKAEGRRKPTTDRTSKKCGCLFKFEVIETAKGSDLWTLHYPNEEHKTHNHGPSPDQTSDPRARKLPAEVSREVDGWLREGWLVSKVQEELRERGFRNVLNTDLYNRKRLLKKEDAQVGS